VTAWFGRTRADPPFCPGAGSASGLLGAVPNGAICASCHAGRRTAACPNVSRHQRRSGCPAQCQCLCGRMIRTVAVAVAGTSPVSSRSSPARNAVDPPRWTTRPVPVIRPGAAGRRKLTFWPGRAGARGRGRGPRSGWGKCWVARFQIQAAPSPGNTSWRMRAAPRRRASPAIKIPNSTAGAGW